MRGFDLRSLDQGSRAVAAVLAEHLAPHLFRLAFMPEVADVLRDLPAVLCKSVVPDVGSAATVNLQLWNAGVAVDRLAPEHLSCRFAGRACWPFARQLVAAAALPYRQRDVGSHDGVGVAGWTEVA